MRRVHIECARSETGSGWRTLRAAARAWEWGASDWQDRDEYALSSRGDDGDGWRKTAVLSARPTARSQLRATYLSERSLASSRPCGGFLTHGSPCRRRRVREERKTCAAGVPRCERDAYVTRPQDVAKTGEGKEGKMARWRRRRRRRRGESEFGTRSLGHKHTPLPLISPTNYLQLP
ncbi:hypothetical protein BV20DRAFT_969575 [Pilatotrama ljubarskyi]|nr:hypothetical protein BV20DRAFT_969575 [Pilatotrama ljubarskyi]